MPKQINNTTHHLTKGWTKEEEEFVKENYQTMSDREIAQALGKSAGAIQSKRVRMNLTKYRCKPWTTKEVHQLKALSQYYTVKEMSQMLGRGESSIRPKLKELGLSFKRDIKEYALYDNDNLLAIGSANSIAQQVGIKPETVYQYGTPSYQSRASNTSRVLIEISEEGDIYENNK